MEAVVSSSKLRVAVQVYVDGTDDKADWEEVPHNTLLNLYVLYSLLNRCCKQWRR